MKKGISIKERNRLIQEVAEY